MRFKVLLYLIISGMIFTQGTFPSDYREEFCSGNQGICVLLEQKKNNVDIYLRNRFPYSDIITTVTFEHSGKPENIKCTTPLPLTVVCRGNEPVKVLSFIIDDYSRSWNTHLNWYWQYGSPGDIDDKYPYSLPYIKGERFRVCQGFNDTPTHHGNFAYSIDWLMPEGTPICAARGGTVVYVIDHFSGGGFKKEFLDKNNTVQILHDDGSLAQYTHIKKDGAAVKPGERVKPGDIIAYSGNVGYSQSPHLHFNAFRPVNGKSSRSIPVGFITDYSDYDIPEKTGIYSWTGITTKKVKPSVYIEDMVFCKDIVNHNPADITDTFSPKDKFKVFLPLDLKRNHKIGFRLYKEGVPAPLLNYSWTVKKEWWYTTADINLSDFPSAPGRWRAEIIFDNKKLGSREFTVKPLD
ncbi:MAG TPA: peptidoglycan DD-metalloendopeptidase family protein [Spirochaetota bacterium]|nr:peptidoglycan DD-metalloendopeptidase family protein [Spirochaetota bacterium]